jgi:DNA-binding MarR family transcriptional regulator
MEKLGLIEKEQNVKDARVSYVKLRRSGKRNMTESLASANRLAQDIFPADRMKKLEGLSEVLIDLGGSIK